MKEHKLALVIMVIAVAFIMLAMSFGAGNNSVQPTSTPSVQQAAASIPSGYNFYHYNPAKAVSYGNLIDTKYFHATKYPAGINASTLQKNLDYFNSEDCAHFVSEALIAGGLTTLATNPPGDNLQGFDGGAFVGSYGIVGVYRLVDFLAGYHLQLFSTNKTVESTLDYQPIPASYVGSPHASIYYVLNDSMYPAYFLSPGDVVADGGVGGGHTMLYLGNGTVVQTDPAGKWQYAPGPFLGDINISFYGMDTLNGQNVSSLYIHMPTFSSTHSVRITVLDNGNQVRASTLTTFSTIPANQDLTLIGSFPDGVGIGNYTYTWTDNGQVISHAQVLHYKPAAGTNSLVLQSTGSNGTATTSFTFYSGSVPATGYFILRPGFSGPLSAFITYAVIAAVVASVAVVAIRRRGKNKGN